ncbi:MAG: hypothetical protein ABIH25_00690 [Candidatus Woesearchaeota archaeon]
MKRDLVLIIVNKDPDSEKAKDFLSQKKEKYFFVETSFDSDIASRYKIPTLFIKGEPYQGLDNLIHGLTYHYY